MTTKDIVHDLGVTFLCAFIFFAMFFTLHLWDEHIESKANPVIKHIEYGL